MIELLNWRDKGFFGKKENISIHELADKGAEWGLFLSDSNTPLSAKTIEIELGEIWRGEHLQKYTIYYIFAPTLAKIKPRKSRRCRFIPKVMSSLFSCPT